MFERIELKALLRAMAPETYARIFWASEAYTMCLPVQYLDGKTYHFSIGKPLQEMSWY